MCMYKFFFRLSALIVLFGMGGLNATMPRTPEMADSQVWSEDYAKALKMSQATGKPLLLAFVGSEWCPWSQKLIRDILGKSEFLTELQQQMIFVWVDFPDESKTVIESLQKNEGLKNLFGVQELPSLVLVDPSGDEIGKFGYVPVSPKEMAAQLKMALVDYKHLKEIVGSPKLISLKTEELEKLYRKASQLGRETEKKSVLEVGLKNEGAFFLLKQYEQMIATQKLKDPSVQKMRRRIMSKDPSNRDGTHLQLAMTEFQALSKTLKKKDNPEKAIGPLMEYLKTFGSKDLDNCWRVEMTIAQFLFSKNRLQEALSHAKNSYEIAPNEYKSEVAQSLEYLASKVSKKKS